MGLGPLGVGGEVFQDVDGAEHGTAVPAGQGGVGAGDRVGGSSGSDQRGGDTRDFPTAVAVRLTLAGGQELSRGGVGGDEILSGAVELVEYTGPVRVLSRRHVNDDALPQGQRADLECAVDAAVHPHPGTHRDIRQERSPQDVVNGQGFNGELRGDPQAIRIPVGWEA